MILAVIFLLKNKSATAKSRAVAAALCNGLGGRFFNRFFVVRDPFYILPETVAPFVMPFVMVAVMFFGEALIDLGYFGCKRPFFQKNDSFKGALGLFYL